MITRQYLLFFVIVFSAVYLSSCITPESVILHGDISGSVTEAETAIPIQGALVELIQDDIPVDTTRTGIDGAFLIKNITPGNYTIKASQFAYTTVSKNIEIKEAKTGLINLSMGGIPIPDISETYLDFGLDKSTMNVVISNVGKKKLSYVINTSKDWIAVNPFSGEITSEYDTIIVTINRTALFDSIIYKEKIEITSTGGTTPLQDTIGIYLNGVMDIRDLRYYKIVRIGTQTWMAENLDAGEQIDVELGAINNGILEKQCYYNEVFNCEIYGGLYEWEEAMQYNPSDSGTTGTTMGICPEGYHVPTEKEWLTLINYLDGSVAAGGKLKETGTIHWLSPNTSATNSTGFTALPGGFLEGTGAAGLPVLWSYEINATGTFWTATIPAGGEPIFGLDIGNHMELHSNKSLIEVKFYPDRYIICSVRCIKNP